ncbi:LOW QUALITY PROTEIN: Ral guanine nucleotide dissociation stimulator [Galemys pyrenaicus]|uniref:Ral guanine nucleotide dissociation stimulator n=1 Tax=Galemys pyrenaicus TaxID=202257 RepID=A0A8J6DIB2_GALPY|nr:LOW QUALITY PROTEIN: Ral guanine nucleotide dissociation stimulator [Galemys pyrenaicus]
MARAARPAAPRERKAWLFFASVSVVTARRWATSRRTAPRSPAPWPPPLPAPERMWAEAAGPAGGAEPLFPGSRRSRSAWAAVRLELGGPDSCPVVLHSFTQLDPDLPRLEVERRAVLGQGPCPMLAGPRPWLCLPRDPGCLRPGPSPPSVLSLQSSTQEIGEELVNGVIYSISLRKVQVHQGANKGQRWLGCESEAALSVYETCKVRTVKAGTLERLVEHLVPAFQGSDLSYVTVFLCTYRAFTTTQQVLDLLFKRYGCVLPYSSGDGGPQDQLKSAISSILGTWLDQYSEDFCQPPDFPCLRQLVAYVQLNMPGSDLERRAHLLLAQLERAEPVEAAPEGAAARAGGTCGPGTRAGPLPGGSGHVMGAAGHTALPLAALLPVPAPALEPAPEREPTPAEALVPVPLPAPDPEPEPAPEPGTAAALGSALGPAPEPEPVPRSPATSAAELEAAPSPTLELEPALVSEPPWPAAAEDGLTEEKPHILAFAPDLVAEQFTLMDAELFKKVVPYHCLGSIWSQRDKKGKEHLAPTVRATVTQFNSVANCVITTCLGARGVTARARARVLEHWIEVARECRLLKNFSSLYAILSALQSNSIHRLKKTWEEVSRDSLRIFQKLSEIFSDENNYSLSRELLIKEGTSKFATLEVNPKRAQKRPKETGVIQGTIPYLGTFLTDLVMLDTAMKDYLYVSGQRAGGRVGGQPGTAQHPAGGPGLGRAWPSWTQPGPQSCTGRLINFEKRRKEFEVIAQIRLLQSACNNYSILPEARFVAWFHSLERLSESESYSLSCALEPPSESASSTLKARKSTAIVKRWSDRQVPSTELSASGSAHSKSCDQLRCGPYLSSGDVADALSVHSAGSSSSDVEEINMSFVPESPDAQEKKVPAPPRPGPGQPPTAEAESSRLLTALSPQFWESTSQSSPETSGISSASSSTSSSSASTTPVASTRTHKRSVSGVCGHGPALPLYNQQVGDCCIIRVSLDVDNGNMYKSILVTSQDKAPAVIRKAMDKHNLDEDEPDDYELVQVISEERSESGPVCGARAGAAPAQDTLPAGGRRAHGPWTRREVRGRPAEVSATELKIPDNANVFYAMNSAANYDFVLKKRTFSKGAKVRHGASSTLPRMKQKGLKLAKGIF